MALGHDVQKNPGEKCGLRSANNVRASSSSSRKQTLRPMLLNPQSLTAGWCSPPELRWPKPLLHFGAGPGLAQTSCLQRLWLPAQGGEMEHFSAGRHTLFFGLHVCHDSSLPLLKFSEHEVPEQCSGVR